MANMMTFKQAHERYERYVREYPVGTRVEYTFGPVRRGTVVGHERDMRVAITVELDHNGLHLPCSGTFLRKIEE